MQLEITDVTKAFGGVVALKEVSFSVTPGTVFGLIGPNGAGKTTMFNIIAGVFKPTSGSVKLGDVNLERESNHARVRYGIARTFQNIRLFPNMTALQNVMLGMHSQLGCTLLDAIFHTPRWKREEREAKDKAMNFLESFGLFHRRNDLARSLSYGEQRILEMTRALVTGAKMILLDEPAAGLDPVESARLVDFIRTIKNELERTVLIVEHDMSVVMKVCENIVVLDHGVKIAEGKPEEIQKNRQVIEAYLGRKFADGIAD